MPLWLWAGFWDLLAGSALLIGAAIGYLARVPQRLIAAIWMRDPRMVEAPVHPGRAEPAGAAAEARQPAVPHGRGTDGG